MGSLIWGPKIRLVSFLGPNLTALRVRAGGKNLFSRVIHILIHSETGHLFKNSNIKSNKMSLPESVKILEEDIKLLKVSLEDNVRLVDEALRHLKSRTLGKYLFVMDLNKLCNGTILISLLKWQMTLRQRSLAVWTNCEIIWSLEICKELYALMATLQRLKKGKVFLCLSLNAF